MFGKGKRDVLFKIGLIAPLLLVLIYVKNSFNIGESTSGSSGSLRNDIERHQANSNKFSFHCSNDLVLESSNTSHSSCATIGWPSEQLNVNDFIISDEEATNLSQISVVWAMPASFPVQAESLLSTLKKNGKDVTLFCGFMEECLHLQDDFNVIQLNIRSECEGTPLQLLVNQQNYHKLMAGILWPNYIQSMASLCVLYKQGGTMLNPLYVTNKIYELSFQSQWISSGGMLHHGAGLGKYSETVVVAMLAVANHYPCYVMGSSWPLEFDMDHAIGKSIACTKNIDHYQQVTISNTDFNSSIPTLEGHYGTLMYDKRVTQAKDANAGDETQGFSGLQFIPFLDNFVDRETMSSFRLSSGESNEKVTMFINAFYGAASISWPPSSTSLNPFIFSMHFGPGFKKKVKTPESIEYLKSHGPIGARDEPTLDFLQSLGVPSYFSACGTLLIRNPFPASLTRLDEIIVVDVDQRAVDMIVPEEYRSQIVYIAQNIEDIDMRSDRLTRYHYSYSMVMRFARAKLVITSHIHTGLPSVAMDTPVIFVEAAVLPGGGGKRTAGLTDLFHTVEVTRDYKSFEGLTDFSWVSPPPNPANHKRDRLRASFWNVISRNKELKGNAHLFGMLPFPMFDDPSLPEKITFFAVHTIGEIHGRMRRSMESVFRHHPNAKLVLFVNENISDATDALLPLIEAGYNLEIRILDLFEIANGLVESDLIEDRDFFFENKLTKAKTGQHWYSHETDLIRLIVLYVHGGVYMDTDVLIVKPLYELTNVIAFQDEGREANGAFMVFDKGNNFIKACLKEYFREYDGTISWGHWGPLLLTRLFPKFPCDEVADSSSITGSSDCDVTVLDHLSFYPVEWRQALDLLYFKDVTSDEDAKQLQHKIHEKSYVVHFFNKMSSKFFEKHDYTLPNTIAMELYRDNCVLCSDIV